MATLLSLTTSSSSSMMSLQAPPPSHENSMQHVMVPDVFVIPPEEEHDENPPWCVFNAAAASRAMQSTMPDMDALDAALSLQQQLDNRSPAFHRSSQEESLETVVLPRRGPAVEVKENVFSGTGWDKPRWKDFDVEIAEVVRVPRDIGKGEGDEAYYGGMKRSKTLRMRATDAFMSIKNARKSSRRALAPKSENSRSPRENSRRSLECLDKELPAPPSHPRLSRHKSLMLTQFFSFSQGSRSKEHVSIPPVPSKPMPLQGHTQNVPYIPTSSNNREPQKPSLLEDRMDLPSTAGNSSSSIDKPSPPPLSKRNSFRKRLSVLELRGLLTGSTSPPTSSHPATATFTADIPPDPEVFSIHAPSIPSEPHSSSSGDLSISISSSPSDCYSCGSASSCSPPLSVQDMYMCGVDHQAEQDPPEASIGEIRLDSLHFDSFHLDPDEILPA